MEIHSLNYFEDRKDPDTGIRYKPEILCLHITDSGFWSTKFTLENPKSQVSYNWVVDTNGKWHNAVDEKHGAWANGLLVRPKWTPIHTNVTPNLYCISVGAVSFGAIPPYVQWKSWARLCKEIIERHNIPMDAVHVVNHNEIRVDKRCPGRYFRRWWLILFIKYLI